MRGDTVRAMSIRTVVVIMNESSGPGSGSDDSDDADVIREAFSEAGVEATVLKRDPSDMAQVIGSVWAEDERPDAVVVAGGDGTVNAAANAVVGTDVVLGVLPGGTFNHFARDIGLPTDLAEAVAALVDAVPSDLDVAEVNGRVFVNNSVLGVYPEMVTIRERLQSSRGWGKLRAVPVASLSVLRSFPTHRLDLTAPGNVAKRRVRTPLVFVGNGVFDTSGRGTPTRRSLEGGRLGVSIAMSTSRLGMVRVALRSLRKGEPDPGDLDSIDLPEVRVASKGSAVKVALDGEVADMRFPLQYRSRPASLRVLVPRST